MHSQLISYETTTVKEIQLPFQQFGIMHFQRSFSVIKQRSLCCTRQAFEENKKRLLQTISSNFTTNLLWCFSTLLQTWNTYTYIHTYKQTHVRIQCVSGLTLMNCYQARGTGEKLRSLILGIAHSFSSSFSVFFPFDPGGRESGGKLDHVPIHDDLRNHARSNYSNARVSHSTVYY